MPRTFPAKNGWQDALQKLREENERLKQQLTILIAKLSDQKSVIEHLRSYLPFPPKGVDHP